MNKNEKIIIKPLMNGYLVEYSYRLETNPNAPEKYDRWEYIEEENMFATWDEVVAYVQSKPLAVPPAKIGA
jgi:hypothetical protein